MPTTFTMPLYLILSKAKNGKKYHINLNNYRNWHSQVSNNLKKKYKEVVSKQFIGVKFTKPIEIKFICIRPDKRRVDRANVLSVHEKFFCDALVEYGCLPDDNDLFIIRSIYESGPIDKNNGRVIIQITEL